METAAHLPIAPSTALALRQARAGCSASTTVAASTPRPRTLGHSGLVPMHRRAALAGAEPTLMSAPSVGTEPTLELTWS